MRESVLVMGMVALWVVACTTQVNSPPEDYTIPGEYIIIHQYPEVENNWPAAIEFCKRHTEAAKTEPEYLVDICITECIRNPKQPWCSDLEEILNDQRRNSSSTN